MQDSSRRIAGAAGALAAVTLAVALAALPELPTAEAPASAVFAYFVDERSEVRVGATLTVLALLATAVLFSQLRLLLSSPRSYAPASAMFGAGLIAIGALGFAAATLATLAGEAERSDPATARSLLDLAETGIGAAGPAFALALASAAVAIRRAPGLLPRRLSELSLLAAACLVLWAGRLVSDAGWLAADSIVGSTLGWLALVGWLAGTGSWLLTHRPAAGHGGGQ